MGKIYCMSDIHGFDQPFCQRMSQLGKFHTVFTGEDTLVLLGDYIDGGPRSKPLLTLISDLQQCYGEHCIVLRGNHEEDFLAWLDAYAGPGAGQRDEYGLFPYHPWLDTDTDFQTFRSFVTEKQWAHFQKVLPTLSEDSLNTLAAQMVMESNAELIAWLRGLPYYYETERQIFVHAGIDEESGDLWRYGTEERVFVGKHPATMGPFEKDIIAGHNGTHTLMGDPDFHDILWDGENHYFCDGTAWKSGKLPVLVYDTDTGKYYALGDEGLHPVARCPKEQVEKWKGETAGDWF